MPRVPDSHTFASSDIKASLEGYSLTGDIDFVNDNGSGKARFFVGGDTQKLVVGNSIYISNTASYNGLHIITALSVDTWFETGISYHGSTETGNWNIRLNDQIAYFEWADVGYFDWRYEGIKDRQNNFRNYGSIGTGVLTVGDHEDQAGYHWGMHGNADWVWIACMEFGLRCWDMTTLGILTLKSTIDAPGDEHYIDVWAQSSMLFVISGDSVADESYLRSFTYIPSTGVMSAVSKILTISIPTRGRVFGDGSDLIFVVDPVDSSFGIRSYIYDSSGNLEYKIAYTADSAKYYKGVYADGYLFVVGDNGISSFLRNTTTGVLTLVNNDYTGAFTGNSIIYDSGTGLLLLGSAADGAIVYSHSSGILTQEYFEGSGLRIHPAYHTSANYLYYTDGSNVHRYQLNTSNDLDYVGSQALGIVERLFIWVDEAPNILTASDGYDGVRTYLIDYD